jgi:predicted RND superfamily exporter protein
MPWNCEVANNPNSHSSASASFSGRLFASVMDYPFACVVLLVLITAFAVGGYLNPSWPQQLLRKWNGTPEPTLQEKLTGSTNTSATPNPGASTATTASRDAARGRRGFGGRGGGGRGGMGRGGGGRGDAILVVQSPAIFTPEGSEAFRAVLQRVESLDVVASVRSLDQAPPLNIFGLSEPILPKANSTQQRFDAAKKKAVSHPLVVGQMLSPDAQTALMEIQYDWIHIQKNADCTEPLLAAARQAALEHPSVPMSFQVTGAVPIRLMLLENNRNNEIRYQITGYAMILVMSIFLFRGLSVVLVVAAAPVIGVFWTLGILRYFDWQDNPFSFVILPVLLSLVGFTDGVHMMIHIRKCMQEGMVARDACKRTLELVGLACFLTSLTTAIGMGSLALAHHQVVREFGWSCVIGVVATWISVMLVIPLVSMTRWSQRFSRGSQRDFLDRGLSAMGPAIHWIVQRDRAVSFFAIALTLLLTVIALQLRPDDRKSSALPTGSDALAAMNHLDSALGGLDVCSIQLNWDPSKLSSEKMVVVISEIEETLLKEPWIGHPLSVVTLLNALPGDGTAIDKISMAELLPPPLRQRLFSEENSQAMVTFRCQDRGTAHYKETYERIEKNLDRLTAENPGLTCDMQGDAIWRWRNLYKIVTDLTASLGSAAVVIFGVLAIAYRSLRLGLIAIIPNMLPLLSAATFMAITGQPLEIVSVCCFTICLGIAVDDTIHFMSRYLEEKKHGGDHHDIIERSFNAVGTGMVMTTVVLVAGFSSVLFSNTKDHRVFGTLGVITLVIALLCDMLLLPALLAYFDRPKKSSAEIR